MQGAGLELHLVASVNERMIEEGSNEDDGVAAGHLLARIALLS